MATPNTSKSAPAAKSQQSVAEAIKQQVAQPADSAASLGDLPSDPVAEAEARAGTRSTAGGGTTQTEPKPEDYPASAKVTPPAEQLNSALSQVVGHAAPPSQGGTAFAGSDQIVEAAEAAEEGITEAREKTEAEFARRREAASE